MAHIDEDVLWDRIAAVAGQRFETITGRQFTYTVDGNQLTTDRTDFPIHRSQFSKAVMQCPAHGPGALSADIMGPSYVWAVLHDDRIRQGDW